MRNYQMALFGFFFGFFLMFGFNPSFNFDPGYGDDVCRNATIGSMHPVGEKFGGGVKIADFNGGNEVDIEPTGPGGN